MPVHLKLMEKTIFSNIVFKCPIFEVEEATVELNGGTREKRWYVVKRPAVGVLAFDSKGRLLLLREFRSAAGEESWRIPAGGLEGEEDPKRAAQRELREETGFRANKLTLFKKLKHPSSYIKQTLYFFLGQELKRDPLPKEKSEFLKVVPIRLKEAVELARTGRLKQEMAEVIIDLAKMRKPKV